MSVTQQSEVPVLIGGKWTMPVVQAYNDVHNPSTGETIARTPICAAADVDKAVQAAKRAFPAWANTPAPTRAAVMFKYRQLVTDHLEELARLVTRENGKTLDEARGDVKRGLEVVELSCGIGHLLKGEVVPQVAEQIDGVTSREPIGVCAGIAPFNFPAMVPMWMYPLAIACGNTFLLKPSEKTPLTAARLAELFVEAGLPDGVLNIVHGGREVVDALCTHPDIVAISFIGSSAVAKHVYTLGTAHDKRVQAGGGAKNVLVVMPDADPEPTLRAIMGSAYGCAGQRCMAGSLLAGVGEAADGLQRRVLEAIDKLKIGNTYDDPTAQMGPVIDEAARNRIRQYIDAGINEGATLVRDGRQLKMERGYFVGPTLFDNVKPT